MRDSFVPVEFLRGLAAYNGQSPRIFDKVDANAYATRERLVKYASAHPDLKSRFSEAAIRVIACRKTSTVPFCLGQIRSKLRLRDTLSAWSGGRSIEKIAICCSWYGVLTHFLLDLPILSAARIYEIDFDPQNLARSACLHAGHPGAGRITRLNQDICSPLDWESFDLVINCSLEQIQDPQKWLHSIPPQIPLLLQASNDFGVSHHRWCFDSVSEFEAALNLKTVIFKDSFRIGKAIRHTVFGFL